MDIMEYSREERLRRAGCMEQLYGVRAMTLDEGRGKGSSVWEAETGGGLVVDVLPDNALDLGRVRYKGMNISFLAKNGFVGHSDYSLTDFARNFYAGMMYTCGLDNCGDDCVDKDGAHAAHGRIHFIPSEYRFYRVDEEKGAIVMGGRLREAQLFGYSLQIDRTITMPIGGSKVIVEDDVTNTSPIPTEFMLLYHFNFGFPFLTEDLKLILPEGTVTVPRTEEAKKGMNDFHEFTKPVDVYAEQVFFHHLPDSEPVATMENAKLGIGAKISFDKAATPILAQWKNMQSTDYVLGIEPTNSYIMGRKAERENGTLPVLQGFETVHTHVELSLYDL